MIGVCPQVSGIGAFRLESWALVAASPAWTGVVECEQCQCAACLSLAMASSKLSPAPVYVRPAAP
jgi:hypothetical protein